MADLLEQLKSALADRYTIEHEIGRGGMATVYLAEDLKHHRKVAIKVLRPELSASLFAERFLREIEITANLNHPHILPLLDSGEADGSLYYVMPLVEGESLRDRLNREKQLPINDAVKIASEVADALYYAHGHNVIHRDVKPENILLEAGHAVVADFGIARAITEAGGGHFTETGISFGTPAYMSPEQASGEHKVDGRSDIYALGCVLFEMLAGEPPYTGPNAQVILARKLVEPVPRISVVRETVPVAVEQAVNRALAKTPADRIATAQQFREALSQLEVTPLHADQLLDRASSLKNVTSIRSWRSYAVIATSFGVLATVLWAFGVGRSPDPRSALSPGVTLQMPLSQPVTDAPDLIFDLSPDGRTFVFVGRTRGGQQLYRQHVSGLEAEPIAGTAGARTPSFSPNGQFVAFLAQGCIQRVPVGGGLPSIVVNAPGNVQGITWADDGKIIFAPGSASGLLAVHDTGGDLHTITEPDSGIGVFSHRWPQALPGDTGVLFTAWTGRPESSRIAVLSFKTDSLVYLVHGITARYLATGHLVSATSDGRLEVRSLDLETMRVGPEAREVARGVRTSPEAVFAVSREGTLVYRTQETARRTIVIVDRAGHTVSELPLTGDLSDPRFSPDGTRLAFTQREGGLASVWIYDLQDNSRARITTTDECLYPLWSPDGQRLAFACSRAGRIDLRWIGLSEGGAPQTLLSSPGDQMPEAWSPDGRELVFRQTVAGTGRDIWRLSLLNTSDVAALRVTSADERSSAVSPDGRWLAYVSDESGRDEVYVSTYAEGAEKWQVSTAGGSEPAWSPTGTELFYRSGIGLYGVEIMKEEFAIGSRDLLFEGAFMENPFRTNYDVHPDGQHFVFVSAPQTRIEVVVMMNWTQ
jgi:serine/threonine protein kinase/Tol biopolymer transport system component